MAKWNLDTIEADMAEIRESVDKLQEINRLQAGTIEWLMDAQRRDAVALQKASDDIEALREQLRQAQQSLRNARDSALEDALGEIEALAANGPRAGEAFDALSAAFTAICSLKSTTQGSRE